MRCDAGLLITVLAFAQASCATAPSAADGQSAIQSSSAVPMTVRTDRTVYSRKETIRVAISNAGAAAFEYFDGPGCAVSFQRRVDGQWRQEFVSSIEQTKVPCDRVNVESGASAIVERTIDLEPPPGTYRVQFRNDLGTTLSSEFSIVR